jgi:hypothetical protein
MNCKDIIIEKLKAIGADGLCTDGCGCGIDDLAPCESYYLDCVPAKKRKCDGSCKVECVYRGDADDCYQAMESAT